MRERKEYAVIVEIGLPLMLGVTIYSLVTLRLPPALLGFVYLFYACLVVVFLHIQFFTWSAALSKSGKPLSRNVPKYLEYVYTILVSVSLLQIFAFAPRLADYVSWFHGDEAALVRQIRSVAESQLKNECVNYGTRKIREPYDSAETEYFYTPSYCSKLEKIMSVSDTREYILTNVIGDSGFANHVTDQKIDGDAIQVHLTPIRDLVDRLIVVREFSRLKDTSDSLKSTILAWIGMLLLPIGIGLRLVKTSLEIFGDFK